MGFVPETQDVSGSSPFPPFLPKSPIPMEIQQHCSVMRKIQTQTSPVKKHLFKTSRGGHSRRPSSKIAKVLMALDTSNVVQLSLHWSSRRRTRSGTRLTFFCSEKKVFCFENLLLALIPMRLLRCAARVRLMS